MGFKESGLLEFVFGIFLACMVVVGHFYPGRFTDTLLVYILLILIFNFAYFMDFRSRAAESRELGFYLTVNVVAIAAILRETGGRDSMFWVAFLQPVLCAAAMVEGLSPWPFVALASALLGWTYLGTSPELPDYLEWGVKAGTLAFAAAVTHRTSSGEARLKKEIEEKRMHLQYLATRMLEEHEPVDPRGDLRERIETRLRKLENPLSLIEASAHLAELQAPQARPDLKRIEACQRLIKGLAQDLFDILYRDEYWMEMVSFEELYRKVLHELRYPLAVKEIKFSESLEPELPRLPLSRRHFEQFLYSLIERAAADCANGQTIRLDARQAVRDGEPCLEAVFEHPGLSEPTLLPHLKTIAEKHGGFLQFSYQTRTVRYLLCLPFKRGARLQPPQA